MHIVEYTCYSFVCMDAYVYVLRFLCIFIRETKYKTGKKNVGN